MPRDIQKPNDTIGKAPDTQLDHAQALSNYVNGLFPRTDTTAAHTTSSLPSLQIVDASSATSSKPNSIAQTESTSTEKPSFLSRMARGTVGTVEAVATGAYDSGADIYDSAVNAGAAAIDGVDQAYGNRNQIAATIGVDLSKTADAAVMAAQHPVEALTQAGKSTGGALAAIGDGLETGGAIAVNGVVASGKWVANHKLETTAMVGAAAVEVVSVGAATPLLAGLGAVGAAGTIHGVSALGDQLIDHSADISVLANTNASAQQREQSFNSIASATGGDALSVASAAAGLGAAKLLGAFKVAAPAVQALDATKPVESVTKPVIAAEAVAPRVELPASWQGQDGGTYSFSPKDVTDTGWHNIYESEFPEDERQPYDFLNSLGQDGAVPQVRLQVSERNGQSAAFSMTSDYGSSPEGQKLLLPYLAVDKDLQGNGVGTAHLSRTLAQTAKEYPTAKGIAVEVEDPNAPGISQEATAQRLQRIQFYTERHGAQLLDRPYVIPSAEAGQEPLPAKLLWVPFKNEKPSEALLHGLISSIYKHGYELDETHPVVAQILGQYSGD